MHPFWKETPRDILKHIGEYDSRFVVKKDIRIIGKLKKNRRLEVFFKINRKGQYTKLQKLYLYCAFRVKSGKPALCNRFCRCNYCFDCCFSLQATF